MPTVNDDNRSELSRVGSNRWTRVRQAYQSGELDRQNVIFRTEHKRQRRNALPDISAISTNANATCQKHQFHQLVERVRELQKEIVPDLLLYQMPAYSSFSSVTPSSNGSVGSLPAYPHRQSISVSSGSTNPSVPNQRFGLSSRILERAHQIPERFWIDWQQKQMQDQIEELEYIKNNIGFGSNSSLLSNETDENGMDFSTLNHRPSQDEVRRKNLLFLHEAQRLANERRASLAYSAATVDKTIPKNNNNNESHLSDNKDHNSFNFDQRSEDEADTANLDDLNEDPPEPITPVPDVQRSPPTHARSRSRSAISLPFTYINQREQTIFPSHYRQMSTEPLLETVIEVNSNSIQSTSPTENIEDVAQIDTELNLTLIKRENSKQVNPLLYSKSTVNRCIEFHKFRPLLPRIDHTLLKKNVTIHIPISIINDHRSSSPTLSFKSARSRISSIDDDDIRSISVISSSLSVSSHSRPTSSHTISTINQCYNNNYPSFQQVSPDMYTCSIQNLAMTNVNNFEQKRNSSSSYSTTSSEEEEEEEDDLPFSHTLFTCRHRQRKRKKKANASNLSSLSRSSSQNNLSLQRDLFCQAKETNNNRTLKIAHNTSIISSQRRWQWKQNDGGFQRDVLANNNNDGNDHVIRSSSAAAAAECLIRRQHRKQTRLKRKTKSEKKEKKKKKKKERNKKSPSSTTGAAAEATEASLFQFFAPNTPTIDKNAIFYPHEQASSADKSVAKEKNCFSIQTSAEHQQRQQKQQSKLDFIMADGYGYTTSNPTPKKKEHVRVFVRRRRRTTKRRKRTFLYSSSSGNSQETIPLQSNNMEELVSLIQQQIKNKQKKSRDNKNIIVVNYKPVFVNSRQQKPSQTTKASPTSIPKPKNIPTDDDFSSATHYSRRRSFTTTSSDGSPLRSTTKRSHNGPSMSLDVPDVEDPLMFIEMMYQQLFTEDGRLRSGTEPTALANCVKQIVTNSRRNSISSSIANGSTSAHLKHMNINSNHQQRKYSSSSSSHQHLISSKPISLSSSPRLIPNEQYNTFSEEDEEEEEQNTLVQVNSQHQTPKKTAVISRRSSKRLSTDNTDNHSQIHAFLNSCHQKRSSTNNTFRFSVDDTDNEDLDTFSDLNSIRFNNKTIRTSPSVEEDLTHTDSRLLSSSGYQSLDRSGKSLKQQPILLKSHSENDLFHSLNKNDNQIKCIHCCPNCIRPPTITVIPPVIPVSLSSSNVIQRIQQPVGEMVMKYLNFILVSKNVLLLPLFIFLLRQRSLNIGN